MPRTSLQTTLRPPLTGQFPISQMLPGLHRVRKTLASGKRREFWYAWRGGPNILTATAAGDQALDNEVARLAPEAVAKYESERRPGGDHISFAGLVTRYLAWLTVQSRLGPRTKADRRKYLDVARRDLGMMEVRAFESRKARGFLLKWRDGYAATPKTADERLAAVGKVFQWAVDRGELKTNPTKQFERIYHVDRSAIIWEPHHLAILLKDAAPEFDFAVRLAKLSGLREGDLIRVPKTAIGRDAIVWQTGKSRGRKTIVVPITPALRVLLAEIPACDSVTILNSSRGRPWTLSGLAASLRRHRLAALERGQEATGNPIAESGIEGLRWHDLRGTAATEFIMAGLELEDVALILGWKLEQVREIAARYITGQVMGLAMVKRLARNKPKTKAVNGAVNGR